MTSFTLDPTLAADTIPVTKLRLCQIILMNDSRYPWLILVPRREDAAEIIDLTRDDQIQLIDEISIVSRIMQTSFNAHKLNVAALGNMVRQLHIHIIARQKSDQAWPGPVWGVGQAAPYSEEEAKTLATNLKASIDKKLDQ